jgi:hypothetical protein
MKIYEGSRWTAHHILNFGNSNFRSLYWPRYPLDRRLGGPQSRTGRHGEVKILDPTGTQTPTPRRKNLILPIALYASEIWSLGVKKEHRLRAFENGVRKIIRGPAGKPSGPVPTWKRQVSFPDPVWTYVEGDKEIWDKCIRRSFTICYDEQFKEDRMNTAWSIDGRNEKFMQWTW